MAKIIIETDEISVAVIDEFKRKINFESLVHNVQIDLNKSYFEPLVEHIENTDPEEQKRRIINELVSNTIQGIGPIIAVINTIANAQMEEN